MIDAVGIGGFIGALVAGGLAAWQARKGAGAIESKTDDQTKLLHTIASGQIEMQRDVSHLKTESSGLAVQLGELKGQQAALSDGQRALQDTVLGIALSHVQLEDIVHKREPDKERLNALTAKLTPAPPAHRK
jgi:hypothetical protein